MSGDGDGWSAGLGYVLIGRSYWLSDDVDGCCNTSDNNNEDGRSQPGLGWGDSDIGKGTGERWPFK